MKKFYQIKNFNVEMAATILRIGLGLVFTAGGLSKLNLLLNSATQQGMISKYIGPAGYVNTFFSEFIFSNGISPAFFLTSLSAFEFFSGIALLVGLWVRPLALIYGFLMWTFVISLPVVTTPGAISDAKTYTSPAMLVQIRDIALSGLSFLLFNLGAGLYSLDRRRGKIHQSQVSWDSLGLLLRLSLGFVLIVGGVFAGMDHIQSFATTPFVLIAVGALMLSGHLSRYAGIATLAILTWYATTKLSLDKSIVGNLNGIKRELALLAASFVLTQLGGGKLFKLAHLYRRPAPAVTR